MSRMMLPAAALLLLCGCPAEIAESADTLRVTFTRNTQLALIAIPSVLVVGLVGLGLRRDARVPALLGALILAAIAVLIVPGAVQDEVLITNEGIVQRTGFWFEPTVKGFRYDEVAFVRIVRKRTGDTQQNIWELHRIDGSVRDLDPGDLWDNNAEVIVPALEARGVSFKRGR